MEPAQSPGVRAPTQASHARHRRHRRWYRRLGHTMFPSSQKTRLYMLSALIVVVVFSILIGLLVAR